jgi:hypothetical protein
VYLLLPKLIRLWKRINLLFGPKLDCSFFLSGANNLSFRITNKDKRRSVEIKVINTGLFTEKGKLYTKEHSTGMSPFQSSGYPAHYLYDGVIQPKEEITVQIASIRKDGRLALHLESRQEPVSGFIDGNFKYTLNLGGLYNNKRYNLYTHFWLNIKDGTLVGNKDPNIKPRTGIRLPR